MSKRPVSVSVISWILVVLGGVSLISSNCTDAVEPMGCSVNHVNQSASQQDWHGAGICNADKLPDAQLARDRPGCSAHGSRTLAVLTK
jgi:hypothetical protein